MQIQREEDLQEGQEEDSKTVKMKNIDQLGATMEEAAERERLREIVDTAKSLLRHE